jgi:hypothetical protein
MAVAIAPWNEYLRDMIPCLPSNDLTDGGFLNSVNLTEPFECHPARRNRRSNRLHVRRSEFGGVDALTVSHPLRVHVRATSPTTDNQFRLQVRPVPFSPQDAFRVGEIAHTSLFLTISHIAGIVGQEQVAESRENTAADFIGPLLVIANAGRIVTGVSNYRVRRRSLAACKFPRGPVSPDGRQPRSASGDQAVTVAARSCGPHPTVACLVNLRPKAIRKRWYRLLPPFPVAGSRTKLRIRRGVLRKRYAASSADVSGRITGHSVLLRPGVSPSDASTSRRALHLIGCNYSGLSVGRPC